MPDAEAVREQRAERAAFFYGAPSGVDARVLAALAADGDVIHVAADDRRLSQIVSLVGFFRPDAVVLAFPAWDCLPYDRASPNAEILAARASTLARLAGRSGGKPRLIVTTVSAALQRVPPAEAFHKSLVALQKGRRTPMEAVLRYLRRQGYRRVGTAREPGEYALRGGLLDVYPRRVWTMRCGWISSATTSNRSGASIRCPSARSGRTAGSSSGRCPNWC